METAFTPLPALGVGFKMKESGNIYNNSEQLPMLLIRKTKVAGEVLIEELTLQSQGWSLEECKAGLEELLKLSKKL